MKPRRILAIARKEALQVRRDRRSLVIALLLPLLQLFLIGYGVNLDVRDIPLCALEQDHGPQADELVTRFAASRYFELRQRGTSLAEVTRLIDDGTCQLALVVPAGFAHQLAAQGRATVQLLIDGTDSNVATIAAGYASALLAGYPNQLQAEAVERRGGRVQTLTPVEVRARVWFNEELESRDFIIPGVVALVMALVGAQLTSLTVAREWERGTMELLISTPVTPLELMIGKLCPYLVIGLFDAVVCLALAVFWFGVPLRGGVATLLLTTSLFLLVVLCLGYFVSVAIRSQVGASQVALVVTMLPTTLLSGFSFPIEQMPEFVQHLTYLVSARYYVTILKAVFLKGSTLAELWLPVGCLAAYALVMAVLAARAFHKTLD